MGKNSKLDDYRIALARAFFAVTRWMGDYQPQFTNVMVPYAEQLAVAISLKRIKQWPDALLCSYNGLWNYSRELS
jgi:hypothetical protein